MFLNILSAFLFLAVAVFFGWLAFRSWRAGNPILKWGGLMLSGLLALAAAALAMVTMIGLIRFYAPRSAEVPDLTVAGTPAQIARGEHIANVFCTSCHSPTNELPLSGGLDLGKDIAIPLGSFISANLTPAGPLKDWTDGEIFRTIRNGIDPDGRRLFVMSTFQGRYLSDEDIQALIAYLRSQPAVTNEIAEPLDRPNLLAVILYGAGMIPEGPPNITSVISAPPKAATVEYGEYILSYQDCRACHGEDLMGGVAGQLAPIGPSMRIIKGWTQEQFVTTLRTGVDPNGHALDNVQMPWKSVGRMDDEELAAVYMYLTGLP